MYIMYIYIYIYAYYIIYVMYMDIYVYIGLIYHSGFAWNFPIKNDDLIYLQYTLHVHTISRTWYGGVMLII